MNRTQRFYTNLTVDEENDLIALAKREQRKVADMGRLLILRGIGGFCDHEFAPYPVSTPETADLMEFAEVGARCSKCGITQNPGL